MVTVSNEKRKNNEKDHGKEKNGFDIAMICRARKKIKYQFLMPFILAVKYCRR